MRPPLPVVLEGPHARLEPLSLSHVDDLLAAASDEAIWRWMPVIPPRTTDDVVAMVQSAQADPARLAWAVVVDGRAQGSTSYLDIDIDLGGVEIGWTWYSPAVWASRVNPQCKLLLLQHAFDELGTSRVTLKTDALNARSRAAIGKLGAAYDGTLRHHRLRPDGSVRDTSYFSVLAEEWPQVREGLQARLS